MKWSFSTNFGFNSGTAKGHNLMGENCTADFMMIMNPDVILEPQCLTRMLMVLKDQKWDWQKQDRHRWNMPKNMI